MLIIDNTASMNNADTSCSLSGYTELECALAGAQNMLKNFNPATTQVALMVFPGLKSSAIPYDYCDPIGTISSSNSVTYSSAVQANYLVLGFQSDYLTSTGALNTSSNLVKALSLTTTSTTTSKKVNGKTTTTTTTTVSPTCMQAVGGQATFYAGVIKVAQTYLTNNGRAGAQKVILFLSDGDANATSAASTQDECHQGITAATNATNAGTIVYTAAYGSPTGVAPSSCTTDTGSYAISACTTMSKMASTPADFFPINEGGATTGCTSSTNSSTDAATALNLIGGQIVSNSSGPRLVVNSAQ